MRLKMTENVFDKAKYEIKKYYGGKCKNSPHYYFAALISDKEEFHNFILYGRTSEPCISTESSLQELYRITDFETSFVKNGKDTLFYIKTLNNKNEFETIKKVIEDLL